MKTTLALNAIVAAIAVFSQTAFAQASAPMTREQRKAETAAANKAGQLPRGQGNVSSTPSKSSDKTRAERKAQTQADAKAGNLAPAGEAGTMKAKGPTPPSRARPPAKRARRRPKLTARRASSSRLATPRPRSESFFLTVAADHFHPAFRC
jgi:hypothetical protein